jgi:hypothetical protein
MVHDAWFCSDCAQERDLDCHARCASCGSDSLTPASLARPRLRSEAPGSRIPPDRRGLWGETNSIRQYQTKEHRKLA